MFTECMYEWIYKWTGEQSLYFYSLRILYIYTVYIDPMCPPLPLSNSSSPVSLSALKPLFNPPICLQLLWSILTWVCDHSLGYEQPRSSHVLEREPVSLSQQTSSANRASDKCGALRVLVYPCWEFYWLDLVQVLCR